MIAVVETFILDDPTPTLIIDKYCGKYGIEGNYLLQCCIVKFKPLERIFSWTFSWAFVSCFTSLSVRRGVDARLSTIHLF